MESLQLVPSRAGIRVDVPTCPEPRIAMCPWVMPGSRQLSIGFLPTLLILLSAACPPDIWPPRGWGTYPALQGPYRHQSAGLTMAKAVTRAWLAVPCVRKEPIQGLKFIFVSSELRLNAG